MCENGYWRYAIRQHWCYAILGYTAPTTIMPMSPPLEATTPQKNISYDAARGMIVMMHHTTTIIPERHDLPPQWQYQS